MQPQQHTLILLDVDGVLVHPAGYKMALRALVNHFARQMALPAWGPDDDEIAVFEACGLTNEWDSGALCVGALLVALLNRRPDLRRDTLAESMTALSAAQIVIDRPDFTGLAREIARRTVDGQLPAPLALALLGEQTDPAHQPLLAALLGNVYAIDTPTTRVFQTFVLGHERFAATYGQPALFESDSYLARYDVPLLSANSRARLLDWAQQDGNGAAIFTARPSLPPMDLPEHDPAGYSPEAELAADLLALPAHIPLIGQGRVSWLAGRNGRTGADYIKPSPVQALAAMGAAASGSERAALKAAADLFERGTLSGPLAGLAGRVIVFEDSTGGIRATRNAAERLRAAGLDVQFEAVGVSPHADKRAALAGVANYVVDDINAGLDLILG